MSNIKEIANFHSEVTQVTLEFIKVGCPLNDKQLYEEAKRIYVAYYDNIVPEEELEHYKPNKHD